MSWYQATVHRLQDVLSGLLGDRVSPLDQLTFDTEDLTPVERSRKKRLWVTKDGDRIGCFRMKARTSLQPDPASIDDVRRTVRMAGDVQGVGLIEAEMIRVDTRLAVRVIAKRQQKPRGFTYMGHIEIPFPTFSVLVLIDCPDRGTTGMRETAVSLKLQQEGVVKIGSPKEPPSEIPGQPKIVFIGPMDIEGWLEDPYDPAIRTPLTRNVSEKEEYDAWFPDHPLSRLRRLVKSVEESMRFSDKLRNDPAFKYLTPNERREARLLKHMARSSKVLGASYPCEMGHTMRKEGRWSDAVTAYLEALRLDPKNAEAQFGLADALGQLGRLDESEAAYRKALEWSPGNAAALTNLGFTLAKLGRKDEAIAALSKSLEFDATQRERFKTEDALDSIREDPAFRRLVYEE